MRLPLAAILCLLLSSSGCVRIPVFDDHGAKKLLGEGGSSQPLSIGQAHKDDVRRRLGEPDFTGITGRAWSYRDRVVTGRRFGFLVRDEKETHGGPWFHARDYEDAYAYLRYDDTGLLRGYEFVRGDMEGRAWDRFLARAGDERKPPASHPATR
jgi:hypothetical protein